MSEVKRQTYRQVVSKTLRGPGFQIFESARGEEAVSLVSLGYCHPPRRS
jgi:hypothetical protein